MPDTLDQTGQLGVPHKLLQPLVAHDHQGCAGRFARVSRRQYLYFGEGLDAKTDPVFNDEQEARAFGLQLLEYSAQQGELAYRSVRQARHAEFFEYVFQHVGAAQADATDVYRSMRLGNSFERLAGQCGLAAAGGPTDGDDRILHLQGFAQTCHCLGRLRPYEYVVPCDLGGKRALLQSKVFFVHNRPVNSSRLRTGRSLTRSPVCRPKPCISWSYVTKLTIQRELARAPANAEKQINA